MAKRTIAIRSYFYHTAEGAPATAMKGDTIDFSDEEVARGERLGAFTSKPSKGGGAAPAAAIENDADGQAAPAGNENEIVTDPAAGTVDELVAYLTENKPNVAATVDLAKGDKDRARKILDADAQVNSGAARQGVLKGMAAILGSDE